MKYEELFKTTKKLQTQFPKLILTGSFALYLHTFKDLGHIKDLDFVRVAPGLDFFEVELTEEEPTMRERSDAFEVNYQGVVDNYPIDIFFEEEEPKFEVITVEGFPYKVRPLHHVVYQKARFAVEHGSQKKVEQIKSWFT